MSERLHILQHSLGLDRFGQGDSYRNHFVTSADTTDYSTCVALLADGLMAVHRPSEISGGGWIFSVTPEGRAFVREQSPKPPALTRSQQRYINWLRDDTDMKFGQWLKSKWCRP